MRVLCPPVEHYSITVDDPVEGERDVGDDVLGRAEALEIVRKHRGSQLWAHGHYPGATAPVRWRVRHA